MYGKTKIVVHSMAKANVHPFKARIAITSSIASVASLTN